MSSNQAYTLRDLQVGCPRGTRPDCRTCVIVVRPRKPRDHGVPAGPTKAKSPRKGGSHQNSTPARFPDLGRPADFPEHAPLNSRTGMTIPHPVPDEGTPENGASAPGSTASGGDA